MKKELDTFGTLSLVVVATTAINRKKKPATIRLAYPGDQL